MYGGIASKIGTLAKKGSAVDVTPNAVNWPNIGSTYCGEDCGYWIVYRDVTGFQGSITLKVEYDSTNWQLYYNRVGIGNNYTDCAIDTSGWTSIANNGTLTVDDTTYRSVGFLATRHGSFTTATVTVKNQSDGNAVLDTFDIILEC
jgi:hypothetical protein